MSKEKEAKMAAHNIYFENTGKPKETVIAGGKGKPDYNEAIQVITKIITDRKINKADRIYDYMTKGDKD